MGRRVLFLGTAAAPLEQDPIAGVYDYRDAEVWVVNEAHRSLPEGMAASRVFQLHVRDWREAERRYLYSNGRELPPGCDPGCFGRNEQHLDYLRTCGVPVYGQHLWPDIPTSTRYPFEAVEAAVGIPLPPDGIKRLWATSSFGYMAALLLTEHLRGEAVEEWLLYGIELPMGTGRERLWEWPNLAYYLGLATGYGITVTLPAAGSSLLSAPHYALGGRPFPQEADHWHIPGHLTVVEDGGVYRLGTWMPNEAERAE